MRPIKLYFAGAVGVPLDREKEFLEHLRHQFRNRLVSFGYPKQFDKWMYMTGKQPGNVMLDSGAFSAWSKGREVDIDEYIQYCRKAAKVCEENRKALHIVNLDVIPGKAGETKNLHKSVGSREQLALNKEAIEKAAKKGHENCRIMIDGLDGKLPIHVFHQGESWKWLDLMVESLDYIGVSPANDVHIKERRAWMDSVFTYLYKHGANTKTHGFAVTTFEVLRDYPWESCDSATWGMIGAYGSVFVPQQGYENPDFNTHKSKRPFHLVPVSDWRVKSLTPKVVELLETSGFSIEQIQSDYVIRKVLNTRFFLLMEQHLNRYKAGRGYEPKSHPTLF